MTGQGRRRLTDDDLRAILLAGPDVRHAELAERFGIHKTRVSHIRCRRERQALRVADQLGIPLKLRPRMIAPHPDELALIKQVMAGDA
jgi:hypothetical protein